MANSQLQSPERDLTAKGKATRTAIMAAATDLFAAKGVAATSITEIAARAEVNRAMVAYYFGNKGGLYDAIIDDAVDDAAFRLQEAQAGSPGSDPIETVVLTLTRVLAARPHFSRMIIHEYFSPGRLFEPGTAIKLSGFVRLTEQALLSSDLGSHARNYDPQVVHLIIVGALNYFILTEPFRRDLQDRLDRPLTRPSMDEFVRTLAEIVAQGLKPHPQ